MNRSVGYCIVLCLLIVALFCVSLVVGSVKIPVAEVWHILWGGEAQKESWQYIVMESRLPQAITALLSGAALAVCGLLLQTAFRNPLAGPSIFGISSGASMGVAIVMLLFGGSVTAIGIEASGFLAILLGAFTGAMLVTGIIFVFSTMVRNSVMLLIIGVMIGFLSSSVVSLLNFFATEEGVKSFMVWGLGNFSGVSWTQLPAFASVTVGGLICALLLIKPLNALLLGEQYAENLGVSFVRVRNELLLTTGVLTAVVTAFCGPISFIGLAVPHIARMILSTDNHRSLLPATMLTGAVVALFCNILCFLPGENGSIPLNALTPLIGAPVIIYVIAKGK